MIDNRNLATKRLTQQLNAIQQKLQELTQRFDSFDNSLAELSDVPIKIAELEKDLMLLRDLAIDINHSSLR
ncbi:MAG: hypothetical protein QNJ18_09365 [Xenococcaceae cyanobacterium MO_167.B52]|nr:hypothetical protein [Xenococcaceae cyanobacterium MO_167.B52]